MINKSNEPMWLRENGSVVIAIEGGRYTVASKAVDPAGQYDLDEVLTYIKDHPEAVQPEPLPSPPSEEELRAREIQAHLAYLASTDWYVTRYVETGVAIPIEVAEKRQEARISISDLRGD